MTSEKPVHAVINSQHRVKTNGFAIATYIPHHALVTLATSNEQIERKVFI